MQTQYQKVKEFMQAFGQECPERTGMPSDEVAWLRFRLHNEECVLEYRTAVLKRDLVKAFDSGLDGLVVIIGTLIAYGITEEMVAKGFAEVCRSNMTKFWTREEVDEYISVNQSGEDTWLCFTELPDGRFRAHDKFGKVIKSPSYSPANLGPILEGKV